MDAGNGFVRCGSGLRSDLAGDGPQRWIGGEPWCRHGHGITVYLGLQFQGIDGCLTPEVIVRYQVGIARPPR